MKPIIGDTPEQLGSLLTADAVVVDGKVVTKQDVAKLIAQVEKLKELASFWIDQAEPKPKKTSTQEYKTWLELGYEMPCMEMSPAQLERIKGE